LADYTIEIDDEGEHKVELTAGTITTVQVALAYPYYLRPVQVTAIEATKPVYARRGTSIVPADPKSIVVPIATWSEVPVPPMPTVTIALISEADAVVSVARA
jgi:hypothetical protein